MNLTVNQVFKHVSSKPNIDKAIGSMPSPKATFSTTVPVNGQTSTLVIYNLRLFCCKVPTNTQTIVFRDF